LVLIILGLTSRDNLLGTVSYVCEHCGQPGAHQLIERVRRFSVFFIPLIPLGSRHFDTCTVCGRTIERSQQQVEAALPASQRSFR
jgi:hypothetical protein